MWLLPRLYKLLTLRSLLHPLMAGLSNLFLSGSEAKLLHVVNLLLIIERCDSTLKSHRADCLYSRVVLISQAPLAGLVAYGLFRLFRPS